MRQSPLDRRVEEGLPLQRADYALEDKGGLPFLGGPLILTPAGSGALREPLPLELVPEVAAIDLGSENAILAFVRSHGVLGAWPERFQLMRTVDFGGKLVRDIRRMLKARARERGTYNSWEEYLDEFRIAAGGLHSLLALTRELERHHFSASRLARDWPAYCPWPPPESKGRAWWALFERINQGLQAAPMALWWVRDGEQTSGRSRDFEPGPPFLVHPATPDSLYGVCILELADH